MGGRGIWGKGAGGLGQKYGGWGMELGLGYEGRSQGKDMGERGGGERGGGGGGGGRCGQE